MLRIAGPTLNQTNLEIVSPVLFKGYLENTGTADDTLIPLVLDSVHRIVHHMLGDRYLIDISPAHDYLLNGSGLGTLKLPQWPVTAITSLKYGYVNGSSPTDDWVTTYEYGSLDYYPDNDLGVLHGVSRGFPRGYNNLRVVWTAGYSTYPDDLVEAVMQYAGVVFKRAKDGRWDQLSVGDQSQTTTYARRAMPAEARATIYNYAPVGHGLG